MSYLPAAVCGVCHLQSDEFFDDMSKLQSKHSDRTICVVLGLILTKSLPDWMESGAICFECVDKVNDYDEAFEKMKLIESELRQTHRNIRVKLENEDETAYEYDVSVLTGATEEDIEEGDIEEDSKDPLIDTQAVEMFVLLCRLPNGSTPNRCSSFNYYFISNNEPATDNHDDKFSVATSSRAGLKVRHNLGFLQSIRLLIHSNRYARHKSGIIRAPSATKDLRSRDT